MFIRRIASLIISLILLAVPLSASAHELETDGAFSAELHIEPYDHPKAGEKSYLEVEFEHTPANFSLADCNCTIQASHGGTTEATLSLHRTSDTESRTAYTFAEVDDYTIVVSGHSRTGSFDDFTLRYPVTVHTSHSGMHMDDDHDNMAMAKSKQSMPVLGWVALGAGVIAVIGASYLMQRSSKTPKK
jgi:hypothetical protein